MREKPILMKDPMVCAVLDRRKTQTRRVMKTQPPEDQEPPYLTSDGQWVTCRNEPPDVLKTYPFKCPYEIGQILWVKETWAYCYKCASGHNGPHDPLVREGVIYRQQRDAEEGGAWGTCHPINPTTRAEEFRWRPSIFMFRWASRIDLEITKIRAERVQDISEEDAIAEGLTEYFWPDDLHPEARARVEGKRFWEHVIKKRSRQVSVWHSAILAFKELWNDINSKPRPVMEKGKTVSYISYPWEAIRETREHRGLPWLVCGNPGVWAYTFRRVKP